MGNTARRNDSADVEPGCIPISFGVFSPAHEPRHEFPVTFDGRPMTLQVYGRREWEAIPSDARPEGLMSSGGDAVLCVSGRS